MGEAVVHAADLSNTTRPNHISLRWTDRVLDEFFKQGDRERELGRQISPLCDRQTVSKPGSQIGFINFLVKPFFMTVNEICDLPDPLELVAENKDYWEDVQNREKAAAAKV